MIFTPFFFLKTTSKHLSSLFMPSRPFSFEILSQNIGIDISRIFFQNWQKTGRSEWSFSVVGSHALRLAQSGGQACLY